METSFQFYKETEFKEVELNGRVVEIPKDWKIARLIDVADYINGYAFSPKDWTDKGLPIIRIQNLNDPKAEFNYFDGEIDDKYIVENGDLLFSWSGSIGVYIWNRGKAVLNQHIFKVVPKSNVDKLFLYYVLFLAIEQLKNKVHGSTMKHFKKSELKTTFIPLPPLEEQKKIAQILRTIDNAIEIVDKAIEKLERIKKATMEQLLTKGIVLGFMFDTNIFDKILDGEIELPQNLKYYVTHIQYDEICKIPDKKRERREKLLKVFNKVPKEVIPTECCVVGVSRLGMAKLGSDADGELYNRMLKRLKELDEKSGKQKQIENQAKDVLIALTSIKNNLVLVTEDKNLKKVVDEFGGCAITFEQFIKGEYREFKDTEIGKIPKDWEVVRLGELTKVTVGYVGKINKYYTTKNDGVPLLSTTNISENGIRLDEIKYVSREFHSKNKKSQVFPGDIIIARHGMSGAAAVIPEFLKEAQCLNVVIVRSSQKFYSKFVEYLFNFEPTRRRLLGWKSGSVQEVVNTKVLERFKIPLPPLPEQKQIAKILKTIDEAIELKKKKKEKLERMKKAVMDKLLTGQIRIK